jgi:hypothetical protein
MTDYGRKLAILSSSSFFSLKDKLKIGSKVGHPQRQGLQPREMLASYIIARAGDNAIQCLRSLNNRERRKEKRDLLLPIKCTFFHEKKSSYLCFSLFWLVGILLALVSHLLEFICWTCLAQLHSRIQIYNLIQKISNAVYEFFSLATLIHREFT